MDLLQKIDMFVGNGYELSEEETAWQKHVKKQLDGRNLGDMSDEETKEFFKKAKASFKGSTNEKKIEVEVEIEDEEEESEEDEEEEAEEDEEERKAKEKKDITVSENKNMYDKLKREWAKLDDEDYDVYTRTQELDRIQSTERDLTKQETAEWKKLQTHHDKLQDKMEKIQAQMDKIKG